ncbi:MAG: hypothetical protein JRH20_27550, partial [Deltaproteobacteria bacterium]|nr:hypothetical protein [Deltaproteobacteria bacterium]
MSSPKDSTHIRHTRRARLMVCCSLAAGLLVCALAPRPASATGSRAVIAARKYIAAYGFKAIKVKAGPASRQVQRLFVPVTPQTWNSFFKAFNAETGYCTIRHTKDHSGHNAINLKVAADGAPQDCYLWGLNYNSVHKTPQGFNISDLRASYMNSASQGFIFVASLHGKPM